MIQTTLDSGYVIDTSALIDSWRVNHPSDVFPTLWNMNLESIYRERLLIAPQEVLNELKGRDDDLWKWARNHRSMFIKLDEEQMGLILLSEHQELIDEKKTTPDADPFVIALAVSKRWTVISSEHSNPGGNPRIPDVCKKYNTKCVKIVDFFRERGWQY